MLTREENLEKLSLRISEVEEILDLFALLAQQNAIFETGRPRHHKSVIGSPGFGGGIFLESRFQRKTPNPAAFAHLAPD